MEPSAKEFHDSDKREPPNSRGMDVPDEQRFPFFFGVPPPLATEFAFPAAPLNKHLCSPS